MADSYELREVLEPGGVGQALGRGVLGGEVESAGEVFPVDHILTNATIYWVTQSIGSSMRAYKNAHLYPEPEERWTHPAITVPTSFSLRLGDSASPGINTPEEYEAVMRQIGAHIYADLRDVNVHHKGGHFGQWENPDAWVDDLRRAFRQLR